MLDVECWKFWLWRKFVKRVIMIRNKRHVFLFIAVTLVCNLVYALTICSKCGHEIEDGAKVCAHCKAVVVEKTVAPPPLPEAVVEDNSLAELADAYVEKQYKLAGKHSNNSGLAFAYYQNAFAVLRSSLLLIRRVTVQHRTRS